MVAKYKLDCVLSERQLNPRLGLGRAKVQMIPVVGIGSASRGKYASISVLVVPSPFLPDACWPMPAFLRPMCSQILPPAQAP
jgi:hypothetical protein